MCSDVVVTGMGVLTSIGSGVDEFTKGLYEGRIGITSDISESINIAGRVAGFNFEAELFALNLTKEKNWKALKIGQRAPLSAQISIICALQAWQKTFGNTSVYKPESINILIAGNNINQAYQNSIIDKYKQREVLIPASYALHFMDTDQIGILSELLDIKGEGCTIGGASASSNLAILQAYRNIKLGLCNACVVVGAMADLSIIELSAFANTSALGGNNFADRADKACRPFDRDREGFIYGQGSACLILESANKAKDRDAPILGEIAGGASCLDANRLSNPSVDGEARSMIQAIKMAGCTIQNIEYINAHATSSVLGDETEIKAIKKVFGKHVSKVLINSTKGLTGHCLYSGSIVETVATLIQMHKNFVHPNVNLENRIDNECQFAGGTAVHKNINMAINNSFGFGGINSSIVIKKYG